MSEKQKETLFDKEKAETVFEGEMPIADIRDNFHENMVFTLKPTAAFIADVAVNGIIETIQMEELDDKYIIRAGKRRFQSAEANGLETVPVRIRKMPLGMGAVAGISTNVHRSRNPVDEYNQLIELEGILREQERILTDKQLATHLNITVTTLRKMRRVETLPEPVQVAINEQRITINNANDLSKLRDDQQEPLIDKLSAGERVTGAMIKDQRRVNRNDAEKQIESSIVVSTVRPDLPSEESVTLAIDVLLSGLPVMKAKIEEIGNFAYELMVNPEEALAKVLGKSK